MKKKDYEKWVDCQLPHFFLYCVICSITGTGFFFFMLSVVAHDIGLGHQMLASLVFFVLVNLFIEKWRRLPTFEEAKKMNLDLEKEDFLTWRY